MTTQATETSSQFELLQQRRFLPFFITQFLGAFNDNAFKYALVILIAFQGVSQSVEHARYLVNISAALFILPFFLFSSTAGQIGDRYEKSLLIRAIKLVEISIMSLAAVGFFMESIPLLMFVLFLMGAQSAIFGPVKYGYLPHHLSEHELVGGNGLVSMGTFLAILLGMIIGSHLMTFENASLWASILVVGVALCGYISARNVPLTPASQPDLRIDWNVFTQTWNSIALARKNRTVFLCILGISWFWFLGSTYMVQLPNYTTEILHADKGVYIFLITLFSVGIGIGSLLCEGLSKHRVGTGLIPLGAIGLTLFGVDLYFYTPQADVVGLMSLEVFIRQDNSWRIVVDIVGTGVFGGLYIVPLFAVVQQRTDKEILSRVIAGNNILNALFMVLAAIFAIILLGPIGWEEDELFLGLALMNILVVGLIFILMPEFLSRFKTGY